MGGIEMLLIAAVIVIPLAIAVAVTLWTLEPAARRAERAKRGRKGSLSADSSHAEITEALPGEKNPAVYANQDDRIAGAP